MCAESLDDDWEKDFDVEVTQQELEAAKERLKNNAAATTAAATVSTTGDDAGKVAAILCFLCLFAFLLASYCFDVQTSSRGGRGSMGAIKAPPVNHNQKALHKITNIVIARCNLRALTA